MPVECFTKYGFDHPFSAFVLMTSAALVSPVVARDRNLPDQAVIDAVEQELVSDRVVPMIKLDVKTHDGIVTSTGTVAIYWPKRAARIATTVKGVCSVVNRIHFVPEVRRTDEKLANLVAAALVGDAATEVSEISVQAQDGVVTSTGVVDFWHEEQLAIKVAAGVSGFRGINSEINIDYDTNRPDDEIKAEIEDAPHYDTRVDDALSMSRSMTAW